MQSQPHYYLALHPHNLPLLCASLKASNTWASTLKCCYHIIENHSVFYTVQYVYEDVCECISVVRDSFSSCSANSKQASLSPYPSHVRPSSFPPSVPSNGFCRSSWARHSYPWPSKTGPKVTKFQVKNGHSIPPLSQPCFLCFDGTAQGCIQLVPQRFRGLALPVDSWQSCNCFCVTQNKHCRSCD